MTEQLTIPCPESLKSSAENVYSLRMLVCAMIMEWEKGASSVPRFDSVDVDRYAVVCQALHRLLTARSDFLSMDATTTLVSNESWYFYLGMLKRLVIQPHEFPATMEALPAHWQVIAHALGRTDQTFTASTTRFHPFHWNIRASIGASSKPYMETWTNARQEFGHCLLSLAARMMQLGNHRMVNKWAPIQAYVNANQETPERDAVVDSLREAKQAFMIAASALKEVQLHCSHGTLVYGSSTALLEPAIALAHARTSMAHIQFMMSDNRAPRKEKGAHAEAAQYYSMLARHANTVATMLDQAMPLFTDMSIENESTPPKKSKFYNLKSRNTESVRVGRVKRIGAIYQTFYHYYSALSEAFALRLLSEDANTKQIKPGHNLDRPALRMLMGTDEPANLPTTPSTDSSATGMIGMFNHFGQACAEYSDTHQMSQFSAGMDMQENATSAAEEELRMCTHIITADTVRKTCQTATVGTFPSGEKSTEPSEDFIGMLAESMQGAVEQATRYFLRAKPAMMARVAADPGAALAAMEKGASNKLEVDDKPLFSLASTVTSFDFTRQVDAWLKETDRPAMIKPVVSHTGIAALFDHAATMKTQMQQKVRESATPDPVSTQAVCMMLDASLDLAADTVAYHGALGGEMQSILDVYFQNMYKMIQS